MAGRDKLIMAELRIGRGLFRLWVIATPLWMLGSCWWVVGEGADFHQQLVDWDCDVFAMSKTEWAECYERTSGPEPGTTWFMSNMASYGWVLMTIPPVFTFIIGWISLKLGTWIARGFSRSS